MGCSPTPAPSDRLRRRGHSAIFGREVAILTRRRGHKHMRDQNRAPAPARQCGSEAAAGGDVIEGSYGLCFRESEKAYSIRYIGVGVRKSI